MRSSNSFLSIPQRMSSGASWTNRKIVSWHWCLSPSMHAWKIVHQSSHSLLPDSSSLSRECPSSSVTRGESRAFGSWSAKREVYVQGTLLTSASHSASLSRVRLAIFWLSPWKSMHSKEFRSKHFATGSHASQQSTSVPRCLFL